MKIPKLLLLCSLALAACSEKKTVDTTVAGDTTIVQTAPATETTAPMPAGKFDWSNVPVSNATIGAFPYLTAPAGFVIDKNRSDAAPANTTEFKDFNKLIMYDGRGFFDAEGKWAKIKFRMADNGADWNQYKLDQSLDKYLESIGAKRIFKGQIPSEKLKSLNTEDDMTVYKFVVGDPWNSDPVRHYALNHATAGKIVFQVWSNSAEGDAGIVQLEGFEQTIKAPTASEMKSEIDKSGKAVLNINFDTDKATLQADGQKMVDEIYALLQQNPALKLSIEGHTDNTGAAARNQKLSADRANTVMYALAAKGIDISRLKAKGYGADKPLAPNDSEEAKAKNRRVELVKI